MQMFSSVLQSISVLPAGLIGVVIGLSVVPLFKNIFSIFMPTYLRVADLQGRRNTLAFRRAEKHLFSDQPAVVDKGIDKMINLALRGQGNAIEHLLFLAEKGVSDYNDRVSAPYNRERIARALFAVGKALDEKDSDTFMARDFLTQELFRSAAKNIVEFDKSEGAEFLLAYATFSMHFDAMLGDASKEKRAVDLIRSIANDPSDDVSPTTRLSATKALARGLQGLAISLKNKDYFEESISIRRNLLKIAIEEHREGSKIRYDREFLARILEITTDHLGSLSNLKEAIVIRRQILSSMLETQKPDPKKYAYDNYSRDLEKILWKYGKKADDKESMREAVSLCRGIVERDQNAKARWRIKLSLSYLAKRLHKFGVLTSDSKPLTEALSVIDSIQKLKAVKRHKNECYMFEIKRGKILLDLIKITNDGQWNKDLQAVLVGLRNWRPSSDYKGSREAFLSQMREAGFS